MTPSPTVKATLYMVVVIAMFAYAVSFQFLPYAVQLVSVIAFILLVTAAVGVAGTVMFLLLKSLFERKEDNVSSIVGR